MNPPSGLMKHKFITSFPIGRLVLVVDILQILMNCVLVQNCYQQKISSWNSRSLCNDLYAPSLVIISLVFQTAKNLHCSRITLLQTEIAARRSPVLMTILSLSIPRKESATSTIEQIEILNTVLS
ncbi:hypothetical protein KQX54_013115 [Cotesia glomerata]|uniref:Uncharacterized protein n=1 Tax=Cotesia glomerata TaxID=32391 RepID=A0AAV7HX12_COTGL|nr:hypothetical protein KQX54_013115 [Cotesia glomerata]